MPKPRHRNGKDVARMEPSSPRQTQVACVKGAEPLQDCKQEETYDEKKKVKSLGSEEQTIGERDEPVPLSDGMGKKGRIVN